MVLGKSYSAILLCETLLLLGVEGPRSTGQLRNDINACMCVCCFSYFFTSCHISSLRQKLYWTNTSQLARTHTHARTHAHRTCHALLYGCVQRVSAAGDSPHEGMEWKGSFVVPW